MIAPMLADVALLASVAPVLTGVLVRSRRQLPVLWIMLALGAAFNVASFVLARAGHANLGLSYLYPPVEVVLVLEVLRRWPAFRPWRPGLRFGQAVALIAAVVSVVNSGGPELLSKFEAVVYPVWAWVLVCLLVGALAHQDRRRSDTFAAVALLFYYVPIALIYPFLNGLTVSVFGKVFQALLLCHVVAYAVFTAAFWRERRHV